MHPKFRTQVKGGDYPVVALLRVSSAGQAEVQHGSLEQQKSAIIKKVNELSERTSKNYFIIEFIEVDISAKKENTKNRPDLKRIEFLIKNYKARVVFVDRSDRLSRDLEYNCHFANMMLEFEAEYYEVETGRVDFNDEAQLFSFVYRSFNAQNYSTKLSKDVRTQGRRARVNNGKDHFTVPVYGIDPHGTKVGFYTINVEEATNLNLLGWYLVKTGDAVATAKYGNELGIRTKIRWIKEQINKDGVRIPPRKVGGELLTGKRVMKMLTSPKVWGFHRFKDNLNQYPDKQDDEGFVEFSYPHGPVLESALIEELKKLKEANKNHNPTFSDDFLLSGFLYAEDGSLYRGDSTTKLKKSESIKYTYYVAKTDLKQIRRLNAKALEGDIFQRLQEYLEGNEIFRRLVDSGNLEQDKLAQKYDAQIGELKSKAIELQAELDRFSIKIRQLVLSDSDNFQDALLILKDEKLKVENELESLLQQLNKLREEKGQVCHKTCDKEFFQKFKAFFSEFGMLPNCDKKILLKAFMPKIIVHSDFRIEIKVNSVFQGMLEDKCTGSEKTVRANKKWLGW